MDDKEKKTLQWKKTSSRLKQAFAAWDELSRQAPTLSADEQRLEEMRKLLTDLKSKIEALSEDPEDKP